MFISRSKLAPILLVLVCAACSSVIEPSPLVGTTEATLTSASGNGVEIHANGAGVVDLSSAGAADADFQFVAQRKADGTVLGHFRQSRMRGSLLVEFEGRVTCLTTDPAFPGRARIGGVITANNSTDPAFLTVNHEVGDDAWFRVQDGGHGATAIDASTTIGFKPTLVDTSA